MAQTTAATLSPLFGINVMPSASGIEQALKLASIADEAKIDFVGAQDHPYNGQFVDSWTLLNVIGARTQHVRIIPNVLSFLLRPPSVLAKSAATLDLITNGRVEMGVGSGASVEAAYTYGAEMISRPEAISAVEEGMTVMRNIWKSPMRTPSVDFQGKFFALNGAQPGPAPAHTIGIWLGSYGERMLRLTGRLGDGWLPSSSYLPPEYVASRNQVITEAALKAGRKPEEVRRGYNVMGMILGANQRIAAQQPGLIVGTVQDWVDTIVRYYNEMNLDTFLFWPVSRDEEVQIRRFVEEVVPAVKAALAK
ncbi:MAG TPA: LLM class flavin-dependent oxidoreductase [Dictyobacter sp.]|jgi:alkanesulfonate monooxygenase SsuD/methylene tetrahydromethanopterin reductase-like flavin-dependent oxidoreductase (luciferase family)|nr:LLM class flavin-dependent oxidoreductase [Dictyobacter sp.]